MSTKSTTTYGEDFHLYREALDDDFIYLELDNIEFEASENSVKIAIPVYIWEHIRQYTAVNLSLADKSDEEIKKIVEEEVNKRIEEYRRNKNNKFLALAGSLAFGNADLPREEQIKKGIASYIEWRDEQKKTKEAIEKLSRK